MAHEVPSAELRRAWDPASLPFEATSELAPLEGIIGQDRATSALHFGLEIEAVGYNLYVAGPPGIGKMTAVRSFLEQIARAKPTPPDWMYVNDFEDPSKPRALRLPAGRGRQLQVEMTRLVEHIRREIPRAFESEEYSQKRDEIRKAFERQRLSVIERLNERASQAGFSLQPTPIGVMILPVLGGRPLNETEFQALPAAAREDLLKRREALQDELGAVMKQVRAEERAAHERLEELDRQVALYVVGGPIGEAIEVHRDLPDVVEFLNAVRKDILSSIETFKKNGESTSPLPFQRPGEELALRKYQVNLLVDNGKQQGAPVVVELNPSYVTLFGRLEKESMLGSTYTDFTMVGAGALHRANGGFLVLPAEDVLRNPFSWDGLKRALRASEIRIEELGERLGLVAHRSLRPEAIPLDLKVVLVGRPFLYHLLHSLDEEFAELFKVKADFDTRMSCSAENVEKLSRFLATLCEKEKLTHLDAGAVAKILEHAARLAEDQEKLSTHFGALADVVREADFWARKAGRALVGPDEVRRALDQKVYRSNLVEERIREMVGRGTILVDTQGQAVGQVNALSVLGVGDYAFGRPLRVTVSVGPGREGIIDIEREVELAGAIYSKGVMIISGYLVTMYGRSKPLSLVARMVFEQSYDEVEGDSASSTELYAILSSLADVPIRQGIAVTGSVNQRGEVQAVGGVNEKIEGFFDLCRLRGLTGQEGVIIPEANLPHLMLREDVVEAVRRGLFQVWSVRNIDEGIELLTGIPAGARDADGQFPDGTIHHLVEWRLRELSEALEGAPAREEPVPRRGGGTIGR
jgi:lon-related putative ATP-dependent protease